MDNVCKSDFCIMCKNFMGFVNSNPVCLIYDHAPCKQFEYNGCPKPDTPFELALSEVTHEYLLNLTKKQ